MFPPPVYVIGTEVPIPGGALEALDHLQVTLPRRRSRPSRSTARAFADRSLQSAFERAIGVVVQPGVEFGNEEVVVYRPGEGAGAQRRADLHSAVRLRGALDRLPAASRRWPPSCEDGFAILKVGPGLTFALREALYALDL